MKVPALALVAALFSMPAFSMPRQDSSAGIWRDDFSDYTGLAYRQQAEISGFGGMTVDDGLQSWSQPLSSTMFSEAFTSPRGAISGGVISVNPGRSNEVLTLWRNRWEPGGNMGIGEICDIGNPTTRCPLDPLNLPNKILNGEYHDAIIGGIPGDSSVSNAALWGGFFDATGPTLDCKCQALSLSLGVYTLQTAGVKLMSGAREMGMKPGTEYDITLLAGQGNTAEASASYTDYLELSVVRGSTGLPFATHVIKEGDFIQHDIQTDLKYSTLTPSSIHLAGFPADTWDFQVKPVIPVAGHNHCTALGPVYVTATTGIYRSPVLDTLSPKTRWVSIAWSLDQNTGYSDSGKSEVCGINGYGVTACRPPESATVMTPVAIDWSVDNTAPYGGASVTWDINHYNWQAPALQLPPVNDYTVMFSSTKMVDGAGAALDGRYFQYTLTMYGRGSAGSLHPSMAPGSIHPASPNTYFGGLRPGVKRIAVNYYACAAMVISDPIVPTSVKKWGRVVFKTFLPAPGSSVKVDVLSERGTVLKAGINSGDTISGLDIYEYPRLKLRATLTSDPADCTQRPVLESWQVEWIPNPELLTLDRNGFRPDLGEVVNGQVRVDRAGKVVVRVFDASGQSIKLLVDGDQPAQATLVVWDGRNERGEKVAPGVYFMSAGVPGAGKVKRVAVLR